MSEMPATRAWEYRRKSVFMGQYQPDINKADAMHDELLARIAELEEQLNEASAALVDQGGMMDRARVEAYAAAMLLKTRS